MRRRKRPESLLGFLPTFSPAAGIRALARVTYFPTNRCASRKLSSACR
jgi:hypothetical protein